MIVANVFFINYIMIIYYYQSMHACSLLNLCMRFYGYFFEILLPSPFMIASISLALFEFNRMSLCFRKVQDCRWLVIRWAHECLIKFQNLILSNCTHTHTNSINSNLIGQRWAFLDSPRTRNFIQTWIQEKKNWKVKERKKKLWMSHTHTHL